MSNSVNFFVFIMFLKIFLIFTQDDNFTFLVTGGYRPREHTLVKYIVSIQRSNLGEFFGSNHFCGGSILTSRAILTAAHCIWNRQSKGKINETSICVVAKTPNRLKRSPQTEILEVKEIIAHPDYDQNLQMNDIAILYLSDSINVDGIYAKRIKLTDSPANAGTNCTVVGWGSIFYKGPLASDAMYVDLNILITILCQQVFKNFGDGMLCAGDLGDFEKDACLGDSGSPLICDGKITGVVSHGRGCGSLPGIYTDVWFYRDWIYKVLEDITGGRSTNSISILKVLSLPLLVWIVN